MSSEGWTPSSSRASPGTGRVPDGLDEVALGQVHANDGAVGTFPERFGAHGFVGGLKGIREPADGDETDGQSLQGVQAQLPHSLPLEKHPVLVPPGEQVAPKHGGRHGHVLDAGVRIPDALGPVAELPDVVPDPRGEGQRTPRDVDEPRSDLVQAPQGRPEAAQRMVLGDVGPELTGDRRPGRPACQAQVRDQTLRASGHVPGAPLPAAAS